MDIFACLASRRFGRSIAVLALSAAAFTGFADGRPAPRTNWHRACGWIVNYGPGNWSLLDRHGEWELGVQGGPQVRGLDTIPDLSRRDWQAEGPSSGQGCGCLDITAASGSRRVMAMRFVRQMPLRVCRADPTLRNKQ